MNTNLFRVSKVCWAVTAPDASEPQVFQTVDAAGAYLESIGVRDEEIDAALIDMAANQTTRASFGQKGSFIFSDNTKLSENVGVA